MNACHRWGRGAGIILALAAGLAQGCATSAAAPEPTREQQLQRQAKAKYHLGLDHLSRGRTAAGLRELLLAEELDPANPWIQLALGEAFRLQDHTGDSVAHLERVLQLEPDPRSTLNQTARLNLSGVYIQRGEYEEAARYARELVDEPTFEAPWRGFTNLGWAEFQLGRIQEAARHLEQAIQYNGKYWPALLNLGILESERGRRLEALRLLERVIELEPGPFAEAEAHYRMAEIFIALGEQDKALPHLTASAEVEPKGTWSRKSEEYLKLLR